MAKKNKQAVRGRFIVIDGPDGAGKSTQARLLADILGTRGIVVRNLREPGGTALGEAVRGLLLDHNIVGIEPLAETLLFQAARAQLIREVIRPALEIGEWVICDRFTLSTLVYQGYAGGISKKFIEGISLKSSDGLTPDVYFVLWVPPEISGERRLGRRADRMESKGVDFDKKVFKGFRKEARLNPKKFTLIDARGEVTDICKSIWQHVEKLLIK